MQGVLKPFRQPQFETASHHGCVRRGARHSVRVHGLLCAENVEAQTGKVAAPDHRGRAQGHSEGVPRSQPARGADYRTDTISPTAAAHQLPINAAQKQR